MARDLRLQITGDSRDGQKALDNVADEADKAALTLQALGREMKQAAREGNRLEGDLKDLGGTAKFVDVELERLSHEADKAADEMRDAARAAARLDAQMAAARVEVNRLNKALGETGDVAVVKQLEKQYATVNKISRVKKQIAKDEEAAAKRAEDAAKAVAKHLHDQSEGRRAAARAAAIAGLGDIKAPRESRLLKLLGGVAGGVGRIGGTVSSGIDKIADNLSPKGVVTAGLIAGAAPGLGTIAGGATLAAGALAGVGLGVAGAVAGNPEAFQKKWSTAIDQVSYRWKMASLDFEKPTLHAIDILKGAIDGIPLEKMLQSASKYVEPLARGIGGFLKSLGSGIATLVDKAGPVVDVLERDLPVLGRAFESMFKDIGDGADGSAAALDTLIKVISSVVVALGTFIKGASEAYDWLAKHGDVFGVSDKAAMSYGRTLDGTASSTDKLARSEESLSDAMKKVNDDLSSQLDDMLALDRANDAASTGVQRLKDAFKENGRAIDGNSEKAQKNRDVLQGVIGDYLQQRDAAIAAGDGSAVSLGKANAVLRKHLEDLRAVLIAHGDDTTAVDKYLAKLDSLDGKVVAVKVNVKYQEYNPGIALGNLLHHARGGELLGGPIVTGEHGPEIVWSSRGQYVSTAEETQKLASMMSGASGGSSSSASLTLVPGPGVAGDPLSQLVLQAIQSGRVQLYAGSTLVGTRPA